MNTTNIKIATILEDTKTHILTKQMHNLTSFINYINKSKNIFRVNDKEKNYFCLISDDNSLIIDCFVSLVNSITIEMLIKYLKDNTNGIV